MEARALFIYPSQPLFPATGCIRGHLSGKINILLESSYHSRDVNIPADGRPRSVKLDERKKEMICFLLPSFFHLFNLAPSAGATLSCAHLVDVGG